MNIPPSTESAYLAFLLAHSVPDPTLFLDPDEFSEERHQILYAAIAARLLQNEPFSPALIIEDLAQSGDLGIVGGEAYIDRLALQGAKVSAEAAQTHAQTIHRVACTNQLRALAADLMLSLDNSSDPDIDEAVINLVERAQNVRSRARIGGRVEFSTDADLDALLGQIEWLWPGWILRGYVTAIVAQQEQGKSNVALDLMGRLFRGAPWPDGTPTGVPADCRILWIDTEMALGGLKQRRDDWGLPQGRIILPPSPLQLLQLDKPGDWQWVENIVAREKPPVVLVDALSGAHRGDERDNDAMKVLLQRLSGLAQAHKIAVPVIHHVRKAGVGEPDWPINLDRVRGASAITQFCRSIIALGTPDKTQPDLRRFESIKSNFARKPEPLGYQILDTGLAWGAAPDVPRAANPIEGARAFLLDFLATGQKLSNDVIDAAAEENLSGSTLQRASKELGIKKRKENGPEGRWFWSLPNSRTPLEQFDDLAADAA